MMHCPECYEELIEDYRYLVCPACGWETRIYTREDWEADQADLAYSSGDVDEWGRWA